MSNISVASTDAVNAANFNDWLNRSLHIGSTSDGNYYTNNYLFALRGSLYGTTGFSLTVENYGNLYRWNGTRGGLPNSNVSKSVPSTGTVQHTGTGDWTFYYDRFVGFPLVKVFRNDDSNVTIDLWGVTANGYITVDLRNASNVNTDLGSTTRFSFDMLFFGQQI